MRVAIIVFPGSNCDRDMMVAVEALTGRRPALIWHKQSYLDPVDLAIIPGGFSFGDYLRCGALAAHAPVMNALHDHAARGGAILGVCNGFQILLESGLLPGFLAQNKTLKFVCKQTNLSVEGNAICELTKSLDINERLHIPVAHNEGNYFADAETLDSLESNGQVVLRYAKDETGVSDNPNGSANDIAGICAANGRILGMMPHPERAMGAGHKSADGKKLLQSIFEAIIT
ncbi:phosphoribosylformylglycinamidine synthase subunit PurQ [Alphaproteobacteria bacterium]|jgi:phosphoribosylformylglycinamidine synthase subunit PurQ / glutaminase|nr:phosphoribosylformylglycinamidine synthase subunit PurQ [Alphaproteobacteria bacterium]MDA9815966.1 phosphoribosylformylglycinamidine synthase subunit PurQ [Alphaproteobacteria bacterium]MDC0394809.1 phosphoribosylformylglycinamidine synthase subunit PurQ [Alphaproteobacteria bacterium]MDC0461483.1 phosphoribosylformylglycinamidine synthase subunit PurQ [Alphaproteobacteria bacterium]